MQSHNYKVLTPLGVHPRTSAPTPAIFDTGAGPKFVSELTLSPEWREVEIPQKNVAPVRSTTGSRLRIRGAVALYVQIGSYKVRTRFIVAANRSIPYIFGCTSIDRHVDAILPREQLVILRNQRSTPILRSSLRDVDMNPGSDSREKPGLKDRPTLPNKLRFAQTSTLAGMSETTVLVQKERLGLVFLEGRSDTHTSLGVSLANGVAEVSPSHSFPVRVLNLSRQPRVLPKDMVVGVVPSASRRALRALTRPTAGHVARWEDMPKPR